MKVVQTQAVVGEDRMLNLPLPVLKQRATWTRRCLLTPPVSKLGTPPLHSVTYSRSPWRLPVARRC